MTNNWFQRNTGFCAVCISFTLLFVVMALCHYLSSEYRSGADFERIRFLSFSAGFLSGSVIPWWTPFLLRFFTYSPQLCLEKTFGREKRFHVSLWIILARKEFLFFSAFIVNIFFNKQLQIPLSFGNEYEFNGAYNLLFHSISGFWNGIFVNSLIMALLFRAIGDQTRH